MCATPFDRQNQESGDYPLNCPGKIAIFCAQGLGALLALVPAIRALRNAMPHADITLIGQTSAKEFTSRFTHYFDHFIEFPGWPGISKVPFLSRIPSFINEIQAQKFDWVFQMNDDGRFTNPLVATFGARRLAGYYGSGVFVSDATHFVKFQDSEPEVYRHMLLMQEMGMPLSGEHLEFPLSPLDEISLFAIHGVSELRSKNYVVLHPGGSEETARWRPDYFAELGDALHERGFQIVLTGTASENPLAEKIQKRLHVPALNLAGRTTLGELGSIVCRSSLVISNETAMARIAEALKIPSVILLSQSDRVVRAPLDRQRHRMIYQPGGARPAQVLQECRDLLGIRNLEIMVG